MSFLESSQNGNDSIQQQFGSDQNWSRPLVDMANPNQVQSLVRPLDNQGQTAVSNDGQLVFDNPYISSASNGWGGRWNDPSDGGQIGGQSGGQSGSQWGGQAEGQWGGGAGSDSGSASSSNNAASFDQQLLAQLQQIGQELQQLTTDVAELLDGSGNGNSGGGDTTAGGSQPPSTTSTDPFIASLQSSDPTMAQTLTDASNQLSPQGFQTLEQYVEQNYTGPGNDSQLISQALTQAGLSPSDDSALQNVLQSDMPSALASSSGSGTSGDGGDSNPTSTGTSSSTGGDGSTSTTGTTGGDSSTSTTGTSSGDGSTSTTGSSSGDGSTSTTGSSSGDGSTSTTGTTGGDGSTSTTGSSSGDGSTSTTGSSSGSGSTAGTGSTGGDGSGSTSSTGSDSGSTPGSGFQIENGELLINGQLLAGVATTGQYAEQVGPQALANQIATDFPGINVVRLATSPDGGAWTQDGQTGDFYTEAGDETTQNIEQTIQALNAKGIGVIIDNHTSDGGNSDNIGETGNEAAWFAQLAQAEMGNNMVMFQTENEPTGSESAIVQEQQSAYNAIRGTGSNAIVAFDVEGGWNPANITDNASTYDQDSNYVIDAHAYAGSNSDPASAIQGEISQLSGMTEANGSAVPVYIGETGNSMTGNGVDQYGTQNVTDAFNAGDGAIAWLYSPGFGTTTADELANPDGTLNSYGQQVASLIAANAAG